MSNSSSTPPAPARSETGQAKTGQAKTGQSKPDKQRPHSPPRERKKSAAQRASDANRARQLAVRANTAQPNDGATSGGHDAFLRPKR